MSKVKRQAIKCLTCGDTIVSMYRHDFKLCTCGDCMVDGGKDYFRCGFKSRELMEIVQIEVDEKPDTKDTFPY